MAVTLKNIKELRETTQASIQACKKALDEANGDLEKAIIILRKKGEAKAADRADRSTKNGVIVSYIHSNKKLGVLLELTCETDFVAKTDEFQTLAKDLAMHVAGLNPLYVSPDEVPQELIEKEQEIWKDELKRENKPANIWDKILEGKEKKFREDCALLTQAFVKDPDLTVEKLIQEAITKTGENIKVTRFSRFSV